VRSGQAAHWVLGLLAPRERAAAIAGDLLEDAGGRSRLWFWTTLTRVAVALLYTDARRTPFPLLAFAVLTWLAFMLVSVLLIALGMAGAALLWVVAYVFSHHTGVELITSYFRLRVDWGLPPAAMLYVVELVMLAIAAPFQTGRFAARCWPQRELAAATMMAVTWPMMATLVPLVGGRMAACLRGVPLIVAGMFASAGWERVR
jgi:hypothetical protein